MTQRQVGGQFARECICCPNSVRLCLLYVSTPGAYRREGYRKRRIETIKIGRPNEEDSNLPTRMKEKEDKTAGFKRCDYLIVTYYSFSFYFSSFDGWTDRRTNRRTDILELSLTISLGIRVKLRRHRNIGKDVFRPLKK